MISNANANLNEIGITNYTDVLIKTKSGQNIDTEYILLIGQGWYNVIFVDVARVSRRRRTEAKREKIPE